MKQSSSDPSPSLEQSATLLDLPGTTSQPSRGEQGFSPGSLLAGRYRIVNLVGKGGMGEVYRADDLKLGQTVALKFLPPQFSAEPGRLNRFMDEVRIARRISHPNVCRVYDVNEVEGQHFLSMEYIGGEDLASLLRRIGRLPQERAALLARQMCAGLAAAHNEGVLHRDLKPANIMIDGRGKLRILDFGLAAAVEEIEQGDASGTPAYMAPEQLAGEEVSVRSDIYSLGLVLYEMFSGRQAHQAKSLQELRKIHQESSQPSLSSVFESIDPAAEAIVAHCLERNPKKRPQTALQVAAALPGGDPLAAALAAGETPSPEMVAAAQTEGGIGKRTAAAALAAILLMLAAFPFLADRWRLYSIAPFEKPPQVLLDQTRQRLKQLGYSQEPSDWAYGFFWRGSYVNYLMSSDESDKLARLRGGWPLALGLWYRQSPSPLLADNRLSRVTPSDPPRLTAGMLSVDVDWEGRLNWLEARPATLWSPSEGGSAPTDWQPLFEWAGLDPESLQPTDPLLYPPVYSQDHKAWKARHRDQPEIPLHVEAASVAGIPVHFTILGPWNMRQPSQSDNPGRDRRRLISRVTSLVSLLLSMGALIGGVILVRRNLRSGRGDRKGALRIALLAVVLTLAGWLLQASHVAGTQELDLFFRALQQASFTGATAWMLYLGLEPLARRLWPRSLISWTRLLSGRLRDPLIGRDLLLGCCFGVAAALLLLASPALAQGLQLPQQIPYMGNINSLKGARFLLGAAVEAFGTGLGVSLSVLFVAVIARLILRRDWLAMLPVAIIFGLNGPSLASGNFWLLFFLNASISLAFLFVMVRIGFLANFMGLFCGILLMTLPVTARLSTWWGEYSMAALLLVAGVGTAGFLLCREGAEVRAAAR